MSRKKNTAVLLLGLVIAASLGAAYFLYWNSPGFVVYREAEKLYKNGQLEEAFAKVEESIKINNKNTKAAKLRSDLFLQIKDKNSMTDALAEYEKGNKAFMEGSFTKAAEYYYNSLDKLTFISKKSVDYQDAVTLKNNILEREKELNDKIAIYYYNQGLNFFKNGDYPQAFAILSKSPAENDDLIKLKAASAYAIGLKRYNEIRENPSMPVSYYNDAIYWLSKVPEGTEYYNNSKLMINSMKNVLNK